MGVDASRLRVIATQLEEKMDDSPEVEVNMGAVGQTASETEQEEENHAFANPAITYVQTQSTAADDMSVPDYDVDSSEAHNDAGDSSDEQDIPERRVRDAERDIADEGFEPEQQNEAIVNDNITTTDSNELPEISEEAGDVAIRDSFIDQAPLDAEGIAISHDSTQENPEFNAVLDASNEALAIQEEYGVGTDHSDALYASKEDVDAVLLAAEADLEGLKMQYRQEHGSANAAEVVPDIPEIPDDIQDFPLPGAMATEVNYFLTKDQATQYLPGEFDPPQFKDEEIWFKSHSPNSIEIEVMADKDIDGIQSDVLDSTWLNSETLAMAEADGKVSVWNVRLGKKVCSFNPYPRDDPVVYIASLGGTIDQEDWQAKKLKTLTVSGTTRTLRIWEIDETAELLRSINLPKDGGEVLMTIPLVPRPEATRKTMSFSTVNDYEDEVDEVPEPANEVIMAAEPMSPEAEDSTTATMSGAARFGSSASGEVGVETTFPEAAEDEDVERIDPLRKANISTEDRTEIGAAHTITERSTVDMKGMDQDGPAAYNSQEMKMHALFTDKSGASWIHPVDGNPGQESLATEPRLPDREASREDLLALALSERHSNERRPHVTSANEAQLNNRFMGKTKSGAMGSVEEESTAKNAFDSFRASLEEEQAEKDLYARQVSERKAARGGLNLDSEEVEVVRVTEPGTIDESTVEQAGTAVEHVAANPEEVGTEDEEEMTEEYEEEEEEIYEEEKEMQRELGVEDEDDDVPGVEEVDEGEPADAERHAVEVDTNLDTHLIATQEAGVLADGNVMDGGSESEEATEAEFDQVDEEVREEIIEEMVEVDEQGGNSNEEVECAQEESETVDSKLPQPLDVESTLEESERGDAKHSQPPGVESALEKSERVDAKLSQPLGVESTLGES